MNRNNQNQTNSKNSRTAQGSNSSQVIIIDPDNDYGAGYGHHAANNRLAFDLTSLAALLVWAGVAGMVVMVLFLVALSVQLPPAFDFLLKWVVPVSVTIAIVLVLARNIVRLINENRVVSSRLDAQGQGSLIRIPKKHTKDYFFSTEEKVFLQPSAKAPLAPADMSESMAFQLAKVKAQQTTDIAGKLAETNSDIAAATLGGLMAQQQGYRSAEEVPGVKEVLNQRQQQVAQTDLDDPNGAMRIYLINEEQMPSGVAETTTAQLFQTGQITQHNLKELPISRATKVEMPYQQQQEQHGQQEAQ